MPADCAPWLSVAVGFRVSLAHHGYQPLSIGYQYARSVLAGAEQYAFVAQKYPAVAALHAEQQPDLLEVTRQGLRLPLQTYAIAPETVHPRHLRRDHPWRQCCPARSLQRNQPVNCARKLWHCPLDSRSAAFERLRVAVATLPEQKTHELVARRGTA